MLFDIDIDDTICEDSWASVARTLGIESFRPLQSSALKIIEKGFRASQTEKKLATVGIVTPTSSGKDLLPLAWAVVRNQVAVMFAPFKHLQDEAYANKFHCVSEVFHKGMENTAANLLICAYENSEFVSNAIKFIMLLFDVYGQIVPLLQTMMSSGRLAAIFVNEAQVLYVDESWRNFGGMKAVFQACTRLGIWCVVVFMTATLKRPEKVLEFCGFSFPFDESLIVSPMRDNLSITLKCHPEGSSEQTSVKALFKSACEFIDRDAPAQRVLIFVLYKGELDKLERLFKAKYPRRPIVLYSRDIRPDLSVIADNAIIISTSVLQTGANPPPIKLVVHWGHAFSVEALLQGAGRAGRSGEQGHAVLLSTPHAIQEVLRIYKNAQGLVDVRDLIRKGNDLQRSLAEYFNPEVIMSHSGASRQADRSTQSFSRNATHADMIVLQRALQDQANLRQQFKGSNRCFHCGALGHFISACTVEYELRVKSLLVKSSCCTDCGIPIRAINQVELHPPRTFGRSCTISKFFLEGVFADADRAGTQPNVYLKELLDKGTQELICAYARMCKPEEVKRPREIMDANGLPDANGPQDTQAQPTQPRKRAFRDNCVCM
jgi:hypothetical protein